MPYVQHSSFLALSQLWLRRPDEKWHNPRGKQNYKGRDCGRQFVEKPQWQRRAQDTTATLDRLLLEKIPVAGIARVLHWSEAWLQG